MSYKDNPIDDSSSSDNEYNAKNTNMKKNAIKVNNSKYLATDKYDKKNSKRRCLSEENSREGSISLSAQKVVLSKLKRDSRNSSLENLHTFYLKQSIDKSLRKTTSNISSCDNLMLSTRRFESANSDGEFGSPSVYVEERVKLLKNSQYTHVYKSLKELCKQIKEFKAIYLLSIDNINTYFDESTKNRKELNISFNDEEEIKDIIRRDQFKINTRSVLGVKNSNDWIYGLNIGNIMHLSPLGFDDLNKGFCEKDSDERAIKELTSDSILEKIIFLASAYFCIATELRFLNKKIDKVKYPKKMSEMWHAKAVHTS